MRRHEKHDILCFRGMERKDLRTFYKYAIEDGNPDELTFKEIKMIWKARVKRKDLQVVISNSAYPKITYGFCGFLHINPEKVKSYIYLFKEYDNEKLRNKVRGFLSSIRFQENVEYIE